MKITADNENDLSAILLASEPADDGRISSTYEERFSDKRTCDKRHCNAMPSPVRSLRSRFINEVCLTAISIEGSRLKRWFPIMFL